MAIRNKLKALLANDAITMKTVAEKLSEKRNKKVSLDSLSQKLIKDTIRYSDVEEILEILGYEIEFKRK